MSAHPPSAASPLSDLITSVRSCQICDGLPLGPKPIFQFDVDARILIAGQAPGRRAHESGIPFSDPSGDRLRQWLGVDKPAFYDPKLFAILPMGFCYPGTGKSGDFPPRIECAQAWRDKLLGQLPNLSLVLVIGQYAHDWHLGTRKEKTLSQTVAKWRDFWPDVLPLPHPSPRNMRWFKQNPFFEAEVIPALQQRVKELRG